MHTVLLLSYAPTRVRGETATRNTYSPYHPSGGKMDTDRLQDVMAAASRNVLITDDAIRQFVALSGDRNPIHLDEDFAAKIMFGRRIAPGLMVASYISALIANELPGPGTIYLEQCLRFEAPVYLGDTVTISVRVIEEPRQGRLRLETTCTNQAGLRVISGEALVKKPRPNHG